MGQLIRFGRRVSLPSTVQIVHELLVMERIKNAREPDGAEQVKSTTDSETGTANAALGVRPQGQG